MDSPNIPASGAISPHYLCLIRYIMLTTGWANISLQVALETTLSRLPYFLFRCRPLFLALGRSNFTAGDYFSPSKFPCSVRASLPFSKRLFPGAHVPKFTVSDPLLTYTFPISPPESLWILATCLCRCSMTNCPRACLQQVSRSGCSFRRES